MLCSSLCSRGSLSFSLESQNSKCWWNIYRRDVCFGKQCISFHKTLWILSFIFSYTKSSLCHLWGFFFQEEYRAEGISWHNIDYIDNSSCISLISKKPTGLLHLLDEESKWVGKCWLWKWDLFLLLKWVYPPVFWEKNPKKNPKTASQKGANSFLGWLVFLVLLLRWQHTEWRISQLNKKP